MAKANDSLSDQSCSEKEIGKIENGVKVESELLKKDVSETELEAMIDSGFTREER